jgi:hypothetical protein
MQGVPYDTVPSAPVEEGNNGATVVESVVDTPFWDPAPLMSVSTVMTVPELLLDVSGATGTNAENGVPGRDGSSAGQQGEAGTDAGLAMAGAHAGRVVLYLSTATAAAAFAAATANQSVTEMGVTVADAVLLPNGKVEPIKSMGGNDAVIHNTASYSHTNDVSATAVECDAYRGSILVQYSLSSSMTSTADHSVYLVPQQQPKGSDSSPSTLSCSTVQLMAVGGAGGNGGVGGNGGHGAQGQHGNVSAQTLASGSFFHSGPAPCQKFSQSLVDSFCLYRMRPDIPAAAMAVPAETAVTPVAARRAPMVEQAGPLNSMWPTPIPTCSCWYMGAVVVHRTVWCAAALVGDTVSTVPQDKVVRVAGVVRDTITAMANIATLSLADMLGPMAGWAVRPMLHSWMARMDPMAYSKSTWQAQGLPSRIQIDMMQYAVMPS